jgi:hypothetical protein
MLSKKTLSLSAFAGTLAVVMSTWISGAASEPSGSVDTPAKYRPLQSISYEFGSKFASGYFVTEASQCFVTMMIIERSDPDELLPVTAARLRLVMQIAGLDSEEGRSLNLTCGEDAATLLVDFGERQRLVSLQTSALPTMLANDR